MNKYSKLFLTELVPFSREQEVKNPVGPRSKAYIKESFDIMSHIIGDRVLDSAILKLRDMGFICKERIADKFFGTKVEISWGDTEAGDKLKSLDYFLSIRKSLRSEFEDYVKVKGWEPRQASLIHTGKGKVLRISARPSGIDNIFEDGLLTVEFQSVYDMTSAEIRVFVTYTSMETELKPVGLKQATLGGQIGKFSLAPIN